MCFIISSKQIINGKPKPDIATEDIEVVKVLYSEPIKILWWTFYSPPIMRRKLYRIGKISHSILKPSKKKNYCYYESEKGLYSYIDYKKAYNEWLIFKRYKAFKAIIPKGSKYYISEDGMTYCSNRLKLIEEIKCV